jgi:hypothetical protein
LPGRTLLVGRDLGVLNTLTGFEGVIALAQISTALRVLARQHRTSAADQRTASLGRRRGEGRANCAESRRRLRLSDAEGEA